MRRFLFLALLGIIPLLYYNIAHTEADEGEVEAVVESYYGYLRAGDTAGILSLLTEPLLSERRELLERNTAYPQFLREMYQSSYMEVTDIKKVKGNRRAVDVEIYLDEGQNPLKTRFILQIVNGSWKISNEVNQS